LAVDVPESDHRDAVVLLGEHRCLATEPAPEVAARFKLDPFAEVVELAVLLLEQIVGVGYVLAHRAPFGVLGRRARRGGGDAGAGLAPVSSGSLPFGGAPNVLGATPGLRCAAPGSTDLRPLVA